MNSSWLSLDDSLYSSSRKRSRNDFEPESLPIKKPQFSQIHTQEHVSTVSMLMEALRRQKQLPKVEDDTEEYEPENTYKQQPFWPVLQRVRS